MDTVFEYIKWRGDLSFDEAPFNEVDALIFSRLSYLDFRGFASESFDEARPFSMFGKFAEEKGITYLIDKDKDLVSCASASRRFGNAAVCGFRNEFDEELQMQFSAVSFILDINGKKTVCVSYRGTDSTFVGWKEDFNMSLMDTIPSQELAEEYLKDVTDNYIYPVIITGHSKGGNLAVYAGSHMNEDRLDQLISVYNFDGPGFTQKNLSYHGYSRILDRINTFVPQSSVIGMLLKKLEEPVIIHSDERGIYQHDIYSWEIDVTEIKREDKHTFSGRVVNDAFEMWLEGLDMEERDVFFGTIYDLMKDTDNSTLKDFSEQKIRNSFSVLRSFTKLNDDRRRKVLEVMTKFLRMVAENIKGNINN